MRRTRWAMEKVAGSGPDLEWRWGEEGDRRSMTASMV